MSGKAKNISCAAVNLSYTGLLFVLSNQDVFQKLYLDDRLCVFVCKSSLVFVGDHGFIKIGG